MKKSILKKILALMMTAALLLLCGCASIEEGGAVLDEKLEQFMACIEANDKEGVAELAYNLEFGDNLKDVFDDLSAYWPAKAGDTYTRQSFHVTIRNEAKIYQGQYLVASAGESYVVDIAYVEDDNGAGITMLYANLSEDLAAATTPTGTLQTAAENSFLQWCFLVLWLIFIGFAVFTIVDIIRKKPRLYGLWIAAAVVFLSVSLQISDSNLRFNWVIAILNRSRWLKYPDGTNIFSLGLPVGAIVYWCMRGSLLRQKKAREAAQAAYYAQFQPTAPQEQSFQAPEAPADEISAAEHPPVEETASDN
ncbi:MAG: hypothetical protein E7464_01045 [Ruminococcaceae bacterium]|nr:hypothetical protein [Oscillospiraceae bacterium]